MYRLYSNHVELESAPCGDERNDSVVKRSASRSITNLQEPNDALLQRLKLKSEITLPETPKDSLKYRTTLGNPSKSHLLVSLKSDELIFPEELGIVHAHYAR